MFEEDTVGLEDAQKKKAKITVVPPEDKFLIGTILCGQGLGLPCSYHEGSCRPCNLLRVELAAS